MLLDMSRPFAELRQRMRATKFIAILFAACIAVANAETPPDYSAAEAGQHVGETATVTDKVERVNTTATGHTFMNLGGKDRATQFTVFIGARDAEAVGDVKKYEGKTVTVSGKITTHKDKPQIVVSSASQITVKDDEKK